MKKKVLIGSLLAGSGALLWGVSGVVAQDLFKRLPITPLWLTGLRMLSTGVLLLIVHLLRNQPLLTIWHQKTDARQLVLYAFFGLMPGQFIYFQTVHFSNAATATILQFTGPIFITLWYILFKKQRPSILELGAILLTIFGIFLLVTHGQPSHMVISEKALLFGLLSGVAVATSTLLPLTLLPKYPATTLNMWAMLLGGIGLNLIQPFWRISFRMGLLDIIEIAFVILFGTLIAFLCYLQSLKYISSTMASILDAFEPLSATILAITVLHVAFNWLDAAGGLLIIGTILILVWSKSRSNRNLKKRA